MAVGSPIDRVSGEDGVAPSAVGPAVALFDELAVDYEDHFRVLSRRAYDDLAWEATTALDPGPRVVDVGCGIGRWAERYLAAGHQVVGIEPSPAMATGARRRLGGRPGFDLRQVGIEEAFVEPSSVDLAIGMGSVQYSADPVGALARMTGWLVPGGTLSVLVDGVVALCLELCRSGRADEAARCAAERRGVWEQHGRRAAMHLFDREALATAATSAGLVDVEVRGLLVGFSLLGRHPLDAALEQDYERQLDRERGWSAIPPFTDLGKQLLLTARRPPVSAG